MPAGGNIAAAGSTLKSRRLSSSMPPGAGTESLPHSPRSAPSENAFRRYPGASLSGAGRIPPSGRVPSATDCMWVRSHSGRRIEVCAGGEAGQKTRPGCEQAGAAQRPPWFKRAASAPVSRSALRASAPGQGHCGHRRATRDARTELRFAMHDGAAACHGRPGAWQPLGGASQRTSAPRLGAHPRRKGPSDVAAEVSLLGERSGQAAAELWAHPSPAVLALLRRKSLWRRLGFVFHRAPP
jgi:hypothetical protein